jgi:hypothetical protein
MNLKLTDMTCSQHQEYEVCQMFEEMQAAGIFIVIGESSSSTRQSHI